MATYEVQFKTDTPDKVVVKEFNGVKVELHEHAIILKDSLKSTIEAIYPLDSIDGVERQ